MRLIDYKEIRKLFDEEYKETAQLIHNGQTHLDNLAEGFSGADKVIWKLPDVDAVEVVRCGECKNYKLMHGDFWCVLHMVRMHSDDFCSYGEKRIRS